MKTHALIYPDGGDHGETYCGRRDTARALMALDVPAVEVPVFRRLAESSEERDTLCLRCARRIGGLEGMLADTEVRR